MPAPPPPTPPRPHWMGDDEYRRILRHEMQLLKRLESENRKSLHWCIAWCAALAVTIAVLLMGGA